MDVYIILVILLLVLASADLVVGVSNDAVNFLNSAIGSQVASRRNIMIIASFGILIGAMFAGGMMEVARKGIFNPQMFNFHEVMIIFLAVMFADIILLDIFNTLGLPTSTTVSIVFELLGAAIIAAVIKLSNNGENAQEIFNYINSSSALTIISGIFVSVGVAFLVGLVVMYLVRLFFTFNPATQTKYQGVIWGALSLSGITYFLLFKGLEGAIFIPSSFVAWTKQNTAEMFAITIGLWSVILFLLSKFTSFPILKIVVLAGTFALAMAFASNDLVNFIGVSVAGFEAYETWKASGAAADSLLMVSLSKAYPAPTFMLVIAGIVMIFTLWFSKKARTVTETEISLGRQSEGLERFSSNRFARGLVRLTWKPNRKNNKTESSGFIQWVESRFQPYKLKNNEQAVENPPAFDLVRASVNLSVASSLIAFATSLKLPLSTTFVTFMVAMATSLSDRAWGRDSAVFRVSGVLSVILGWLMTAFIALCVSGLFAFIMLKFNMFGVGFLVIFTILFITMTIRFHNKKEKSNAKILESTMKTEIIPARQIINSTSGSLADSLDAVAEGFVAAIEGLLTEDRKKLREALKAMERLEKSNEEFKYTFYNSIRRIQEELSEGSRLYLMAYDIEQDLVQSAVFVTETARKHVEDMLGALDEDQAQNIRKISQDLSLFFKDCSQITRNRDYVQYDEIKARKKQLLEEIENLIARQAKGIKNETYSARNSILVFNILLETKDLISISARLVKMYCRLERDYPQMDSLFVITSED
ncbi:MAG: inorganic phosphate transporter [Saprospiraceae bacterium]|nr:inorganic phosphate transporter [Saprospiraceae bacterium]